MRGESAHELVNKSVSSLQEAIAGWDGRDREYLVAMIGLLSWTAGLANVHRMDSAARKLERISKELPRISRRAAESDSGIS